MTNLLPETYKKQVLREYNVRRAAVALVLLCITAVIAGVALLPSYMTIQQRLRTAEAELQELKDTAQERDIQQYLDEVDRTNQLVSTLKPPQAELRTYVALEDILGQVGDSITVNEIVLEKQRAFANAEEGEEEGGEGESDAPADLSLQFSLEGVAETRESLIELEQDLSEVSYIDSVDLPVSNFASRQDISFSVTLKGSL